MNPIDPDDENTQKRCEPAQTEEPRKLSDEELEQIAGGAMKAEHH
jgi:bacteriocin-like protein